MRPTREVTMLRMAWDIAQRGTCDRKQVGAVIAREGRVISVGYNGAPPGLPHCAENNHGWDDETVRQIIPGRGDSLADHVPAVEVEGCRNATHAEANALAFAAKYGVPTDKAELFVTVSPCENCARLLIAAGIRAVYFRELYRDSSGLELLERADLSWVHLSYAG